MGEYFSAFVTQSIYIMLDQKEDLLELVIDIPLGGIYVGRLVGRLIAANILTITRVVDLCLPHEFLISGGHVGKLIAGMLRALAEDLDEDDDDQDDDDETDVGMTKAKALWDAANVDIKPLVKPRFREDAVLAEFLATEKIDGMVTLSA